MRGRFVPDRYDEGVDDARLTLRAWLGGNARMAFGDDTAVMWSWTLAHNLRIAGGLCAAFELGLYNHECANVMPSVRWLPGCGRSAP